jgi:hypothetical protein
MTTEHAMTTEHDYDPNKPAEVMLRHPEVADELRAAGAIVTIEGRTYYNDDAIEVVARVLRHEEEWAASVKAVGVKAWAAAHDTR